MANSIGFHPKDTVLNKDYLNSDNVSIDFYNDSSEVDMIDELHDELDDELDALLEDGSKADELDDILTDASNSDFILERRKGQRNRVDETNKYSLKSMSMPLRNQITSSSLGVKPQSLNLRRRATVDNDELFRSSVTAQTKQKVEVDNDWNIRQVTKPKAPRLATLEKNGERSYSTVSPAKAVVEKVEVDDNWKDRQVTIPKAPRLATMKNGERTYSVFSPVKEVVGTVEVDNKWKDRQVTIPKAPRLATMKNGERSYSVFAPAKEVVETVDNWKDRQVTIPKSPRLATMKNGDRSYSTFSPAKEVVEVVDNWKDRKVTIPKPPQLATTEKNGEKLYSCSVSKEEVDIPGIQSMPSSYSKSGERKVTIPQSPRLMTAEKNGDRSYSCAASPMRGPNADYTAWTEYKEKLIGQGIFRESSPSARPLKLTIPSPFHLSTPSPKTKFVTEEISPKYKFKALPLPDFSFNEVSEDREKIVTVPEPFDLVSLERSRKPSYSPKQKERFRALPLNKHILKNVSPSPRSRRASPQPPTGLHPGPTEAKTEESSENQENRPPHQHRTLRVPVHRYATPPTNVLYYSPSKNASEKNNPHIVDMKKLTSPPKTQVTSPRSMTSLKSKEKSTTPRFKAKKMPDFSKPFVPQRRTQTSPMVKRVIPSPQAQQFKARKMPDFTKPFTPTKRSGSRSKASKTKEQQDQVQTIRPVNKIESICHEKEKKTSLEEEPVSAELDCKAMERNIVDSSASRKLHEEEKTRRGSSESQASDDEQVKSKHGAEVDEMEKVVGEARTNTNTPTTASDETDILSKEEVPSKGTNEVLDLSVCTEVGNEYRACELTGIGEEGSTDSRVNCSRVNDIYDSKEDGTPQQFNEVQDPLALVMERLNQSLQRFQAYEEAKARSNESGTSTDSNQEHKTSLSEEECSVCEVDCSHSSNDVVVNSEEANSELKSPQENRNQAGFGNEDLKESDVTDLFREGWHRAPDQGSLAEPNNGTMLAVDTVVPSYDHKNAVAFEDDILTPPSSLLQRRHFEDLVRADTPKTSNNYVGEILEDDNENTPANEMESDSESRTVSLFNPSADDSVFESDEDSKPSEMDSLTLPNIDDTNSIHVESKKKEESRKKRLSMDAKTKQNREASEGKGSPSQSKTQRQALVLSQKQNTDLNKSRPLQIVSERETKLLVKSKDQKVRRTVFEKLKNRKNAMKEKNKRIKEGKDAKRSVGSVFESQKFIYRFCCATGSSSSRQSSPTRFIENNFGREEVYSPNNNTLDDGSMKELKLVFK